VYALLQNKTISSSLSHQFLGKYIVKDIGLFLLCFFMARATILDGLAPFGISFFAAILLAGGNVFSPLLGALAGTVGLPFPELIYDSLSYIILYGIIRLLQKIKRKLTRLELVCSLLLSMSIMKFCYLWFHSMLLYDMVMAGLEIISAILMVHVFSNTVTMLYQYKKRRILSNEEMICISVFLAVLVLGIGQIRIFSFSLQRVLAVFIVLFFSYMGGAGVGASIGITMGLILSLGIKMDPYLIGDFGVCGLLAGTFREMRRLGTAAGFIMANAIVTFYINQSTSVIISFPDIALASGLFILLPRPVIQYFKQFAESSLHRIRQQHYYIHRMRDLTVGRLKEFSMVFQQMAAVFNRISETRKKLNQEEISNLFDAVASKVCSHCAFKQSCWKREFYNTYHALFDLLTIAEHKGSIDDEDIPQSLAKKCIHLDELVEVLNEIFQIYRYKQRWQKNIEESRMLVGEQLKGVAQVISELAAELNVDIQFKDDLEDVIRQELDKAGIRVLEVLVQENVNGKLEIHIVKKSCGGKRQCTQQITKILSELVGRKMSCQDEGCRFYGKSQCVLVFREALAFHVMTGVARRSKENRDICGDSYTFHSLKEGKYLLALSDGMGTGARAAEESAATVSLLEHFYDAGFEPDVIFRTINSVLILRSNEEVFATVDLCVLDLIDGYADFIKIGAVSSYIKKGEQIEAIRASNLPIGIIEDIQPEFVRRPIQDNDFIILLTDGVLDAIGDMEQQDDWMAGILGEIRTQNPQEMADAILEEAIQYSGGVVKDDMTVIVTRIWER